MVEEPQDLDFDDADSPRQRAVRHVIAVEGGRGGVGCSVVTANLGVYLAQLGRRVVLIDADPSGGHLHTMFGVRPSPGPSPDDLEDELLPVPTAVPGLSLLTQGYARGSTLPLRPGRKAQWARGLRQMDADYVLLDLGAGTAPATLDLFLSADLGLCVTTPEPPSVEATYRFARALFQRRLRRTLVKDRFKMRLVERAQLELEPLPSPKALVQAIARYDTNLGALSATELGRLHPRILVNAARLRTDADLGPVMCELSRRFLGVSLDYLGHVEHDDAVWLSVTRQRPLLIDGPTSKSARNLERIARRILAVTAAREQERPEPAPLTPEPANLYDVLVSHRSATDEELRRAYKRQREIYQRGSLALTSLLGDDELAREQARIEEAHDTLLDPVRRRSYDLSMFPKDEAPAPRPSPVTSAALIAERAMLREELAREIGAETEFTGSLLRKVRESRGAELAEISARTKISSLYLRAVEEETFSALPAVVYTRGFLQEIAKFLELDPAQVSRTYLKRYREWRHSTTDSDT